MLVVTSFFVSAILINLIGCYDCRAVLRVDEIERLSVGSIDSKQSVTVAAVLTKPPSRAYNCFLGNNSSCSILKANGGAAIIIGPIDLLEKDGMVVGAGDPLLNQLDQYSMGSLDPSQLKIKEHNDSHFVTQITWTFSGEAPVIDNVKVFLSNGDYSVDQAIRKSVLNLACSIDSSSSARIEDNVLEFDCYVQAEFVEDLLYRAKGSGVLVSSLKLAGENYAFYQTADISINKPVKRISNFHGFVSDPPSRAKLCQLRMNKNCGIIMYEPQSVEGFGGFPYAKRSPPDGKIASGNNPNFDELNEYGLNRWMRVNFPRVSCHNKTHVSFNVTWWFTATHLTDNIHVYASNDKYTSTEPLSRYHLDLDPLCTMEFAGKPPSTYLTMLCPVSLEKYRQLSRLKELLLLSVWNIYDTSFAFYQVMDLEGITAEQSYDNMLRKCL